MALFLDEQQVTDILTMEMAVASVQEALKQQGVGSRGGSAAKEREDGNKAREAAAGGWVECGARLTRRGGAALLSLQPNASEVHHHLRRTPAQVDALGAPSALNGGERDPHRRQRAPGLALVELAEKRREGRLRAPGVRPSAGEHRAK